MRIALNALYVGGGVAGGKVYRDGLLCGLAEVAPSDLCIDVFTRCNSSLPVNSERIRACPAPVSEASTIRRTAWEYICLPRLIRQGEYRVYHALGSLSPQVRGVPVVLTIHDLIYRHFAESVPFFHRKFMAAVQPSSARKADRVIVDSDFVGREVVELLGVKPDRVRVVPLGPGQGLSPVTDNDLTTRTLARHGIRRPFVVAVGRGYPHKNFTGLLRAFAVLIRSHPNVGLVVIGDRYLLIDSLRHLMNHLNLTDRVTWTGYLPLDELSSIYSVAEAFAFPSLSEGFGLPVLEAMACGCPVVASNRAAIPEVVGDAALLVNPDSAEELSYAIGRVLTDPAVRGDLRAKGFQRVMKFSWAKCATETLAVYRELV